MEQISQRNRRGEGSLRPARRTARAPWLAWALAAVGIAAFFAMLAIRLGRAEVPRIDLGLAGDLAWTASFAFFVVVGGLIAARRPDNTLGWAFIGIGLTQVLAEAAFQYAVWAAFDRTSLPFEWLAAWVSVWIWVPGITLFAFLVLLFPTGRLPSPRWRWVARAIALNAAVGTAAGLSLARYGTPHLLAFTYADALRSDIAIRILSIVFPLALLFLASSMFSFILRFRRATGIERQQLKWVAFVVFLGLLNVVVFELGAEALGIDHVAIDAYSDTIGGPGMLALAAGFAILRHKLFDIDVVINRTLVYLLLTGALALIYVLGVVLLQGVLPGAAENSLAVAASTLAVAAAFRPLRLRIQRLVDRSFYREKYDAQQILESFSSRLRNEVDIDSLLVELREAVVETMHPRHVSVWIGDETADDVVRPARR